MTPPRHPQPPFVGVDLSAASAGNVPGDFRVHSQSDGQFRGVRGAGGPRRPGILCVALRAGRIDSLPNLARPAERAVVFYNQRGTCERSSSKERARSNGRGCHAGPSPPTPSASSFMRSRTTSANFMRTLAVPKTVQPWSLTSLREKLIKIGAKVVSHGRYVTFQMAEVAASRQMFADILSLIARLRAPPAPA